MAEAELGMHQKWQHSEAMGNNGQYLETLYMRYLQDPKSVDERWREYFASMKPDDAQSEPDHAQIREHFRKMAYQSKRQVLNHAMQEKYDGDKFAGVIDLVFAYRALGHQRAHIDPLNMLERSEAIYLSKEFHGLSDADLNKKFDVPVLGFDTSNSTLADIIKRLETIYCGSIGFEYTHINSFEEREWLRDNIENSGVLHQDFDPKRKKWLLRRLVAADGLEKFLGMKYVGQKRFSLEGGDALIPLLDDLAHRACDNGVKEMVVGMAHRGRLNVLINIMGKRPEDLFAEFEGKHDQALLSGDVKYHNGFSSDIQTEGGMMHMALAFNPSHLEIVAPVVEGSVRARQARRSHNHDEVIAVQIHGDAAFAGQGVVMETLNMSQTRGYLTGGSVHIVINNQIGFTTSHLSDARSTYYCTDVGKMVEAPIFHVNGNDPEAVVKVIELAFAYRVKFQKDVIIDLVCYRRHGHNEADEPSATQPMMYKVIKKLAPPCELYAQSLIAQSVVSEAEYKEMKSHYRKLLEHGDSVANIIDNDKNRKYTVSWEPYTNAKWHMPYDATITKNQFDKIASYVNALPEGFALQKQVARLHSDRIKMAEGAIPINWGFAELLAYASLLDKGHGVRLSGEDVGRGTFAHRHGVFHEQNTGEVFTPLKNIHKEQGDFQIIDSLLSEEAVLGFEYGFSCAAPENLVVWEAQFGDFVNTAQVVIDQFICSAEEKWGRLSGLTLLLPHGQEGMGAEHSSARLERFLQLCAHDNMQVCVPTTPAQIYHVLRRQLLRKFRKPLIIMSPKSLLRHPLVQSSIEDITDGSFKPVIKEIDEIDAKKVKRVLICQGKVYYHLLSARRNANIDDIAIIRLEQLYPFPQEILTKILEPYAHVKDICWVQEEPLNQGAWYPGKHRLERIMRDNQTLHYVGRSSFAAPAVGYPSLHFEQQTALVNEALMIEEDQ